jgi:hypothetical protein
VTRIFESAAGIGSYSITRRLNEPFGPSKSALLMTQSGHLRVRNLSYSVAYQKMVLIVDVLYRG